jgi:hypothetical protein
MSAIDGRYEILAHGEREIPVWGEVFKREPKKSTRAHRSFESENHCGSIPARFSDDTQGEEVRSRLNIRDVG